MEVRYEAGREDDVQVAGVLISIRQELNRHAGYLCLRGLRTSGLCCAEHQGDCNDGGNSDFTQKYSSCFAGHKVPPDCFLDSEALAAFEGSRDRLKVRQRWPCRF